ncbi:hypothetical protein ACIP93_30950 [Streptomyces sp. NPDC088745]
MTTTWCQGPNRSTTGDTHRLATRLADWARVVQAGAGRERKTLHG